MTVLPALPRDVVDPMRSDIVAEVATINAAAVPVDTPVFPMTSDMKELWEPAPHTCEELIRCPLARH